MTFSYSISSLKKNSALATPGNGHKGKHRYFRRRSQISNIKSTLFESLKEPCISLEQADLSRGSIRQRSPGSLSNDYSSSHYVIGHPDVRRFIGDRRLCRLTDPA